MKRLIILCLLAAVLLSAASADTLTVGTVTPLTGSFFTSMWGTNASDMDVQDLLDGYPLLVWNNESGGYAVNTAAASGLVITENRAGDRTYTVSVREDLLWSDGTPVTAWDYAFSLYLSIAPETEAIGGQTADLDCIAGVTAYLEGRSDRITGIRVPDDYVLSVTIRAESRPLFFELSVLNTSPAPMHIIAPGCSLTDDGKGLRLADRSAFTAELLERTLLDPDTGYVSHPTVTCGPYVLEAYDSATGTASFVRNPLYHGNAEGITPAIERIVCRTVSADTMLEELQSGGVDLLAKVVRGDVISEGLQLARSEEYSQSGYPRSGATYLWFCAERPGVNSQAVRQAMAMCIDRDAIREGMTGRYGVTVNGCYGIGQWIYRLINSGTLETGSESLSLESIQAYTQDVDAAIALLEADGWVLNDQGEPYDSARDAYRCKETDDGLTALDLTLAYAEGSAIGDLLEENFVPALAEAGIRLTLTPMSAAEIFQICYRQAPRTCDLYFLGTNFSENFDPASWYAIGEEKQGAVSRSGLTDGRLYRLAVSLRQTDPSDVTGYCRKWLAFQQCWSEILPAIPLYSNVYYDFYTSALKNYSIGNSRSWAEAVCAAYLER